MWTELWERQYHLVDIKAHRPVPEGDTDMQWWEGADCPRGRSCRVQLVSQTQWWWRTYQSYLRLEQIQRMVTLEG